MDSQTIPTVKSHSNNKILLEDLKFSSRPHDLQMTSSILSVTSSLTSPVDSGVQLLDSESDITSVMSMSGTACDLDSSSPNEMAKEEPQKFCIIQTLEGTENYDNMKNTVKEHDADILYMTQRKEQFLSINEQNILTKSDTFNQNVTSPYNCGIYSSSAPNVDFNTENFNVSKDNAASCIEDEEKHDEDKIVDENTEPLQKTNAMHVSISEEAKENISQPIVDNELNSQVPCEQIVFRRQRKKKSSKSDTPKKRVSFHEDILNSTKIDDIHINHGFITHQSDVSMNFLNWDSIRKKDVVKGRYSWAAEGDTSYYHHSTPERETKSEIYINSHQYSSTSSSSTGSIDSTSSNSLCDNESSSDLTLNKPVQKYPKSSCLKKRTNKKHIETHVVQENPIRQRKSESNLLDSTIFGSLKNILTFSSSIPLAERGVPEGQEDITFYKDAKSKRNAFSNSSGNFISRSVDGSDKLPELPKKISNVIIEPARSRLKLAPSEGFYPNYPSVNLPPNVILCDSTVYEHKGISYSYEYDKFQKSFESANKIQKPKNSTIYQMLLNDLNFFKRHEKEQSEHNLSSICDPPANNNSAPIEENSKNSLSCTTKSSQSDWSSDTETISDFYDISSKHLSSPKRKVNKANHYSVQDYKVKETSDSRSDVSDGKVLQNLKPATSKTSLINRFLRNVTMKKLLDAKLQKKQKMSCKTMSLYMKGAKPDTEFCKDLDKELEEEITNGKKIRESIEEKLGSNFIMKLRKEVYRDSTEKILNFYKVHSAYTSSGETKALVVFLTNTTLYITGFRPNQTLVNQFVLPYAELNTVMIGPNAHLIHFSNSDREMQFLLSTGSSDITSDLVGQLEMAIRKNTKDIPLPAIRYLTMRDMVNLRYDICKQTAVQKDEEYFHYSIVKVQEVNSEPTATPLGPIKEGPLMFKTSNDIRWETGYFILKGGVLYMLSSPSNRLPMQAFPLSGGACLGAHRTPYCLRPHTFELLLKTVTLQLAAPDEYVASEWLQVLVQTASGLYSNHEVSQTQSCTLLLTNNHILTMREAFPCENKKPDFKLQTLSCAAISDIISFRIPMAEQSWCILEFACREVHETSGDLVVYFVTNTELERFISTLELLWSYNNIKGESFPLSTISENESVNKKCMDVYRTLQLAWSPISVSMK